MTEYSHSWVKIKNAGIITSIKVYDGDQIQMLQKIVYNGDQVPALALCYHNSIKPYVKIKSGTEVASYCHKNNSARQPEPIEAKFSTGA